MLGFLYIWFENWITCSFVIRCVFSKSETNKRRFRQYTHPTEINSPHHDWPYLLNIKALLSTPENPHHNPTVKKGEKLYSKVLVLVDFNIMYLCWSSNLNLLKNLCSRITWRNGFHNSYIDWKINKEKYRHFFRGHMGCQGSKLLKIIFYSL